MTVGIVWIGHSIGPTNPNYKQILQELNVKKPKTAPDGTSFHQRYEVTHTGELLCLNEIATQITANKNTHVI